NGFVEAVTVDQDRRRVRRGRGQDEIIEVADSSIRATAFHHQSHYMRSVGQANVSYGQSPPGLPAAAVQIRHRTGLLEAVAFDMERPSVAARSDARLQGVEAIHGGIDAVFEPLATGGPADVVAAADVAGILDINGGAPILSAVVRAITVVKGHSLAAAIE